MAVKSPGLHGINQSKTEHADLIETPLYFQCLMCAKCFENMLAFQEHVQQHSEETVKREPDFRNEYNFDNKKNIDAVKMETEGDLETYKQTLKNDTKTVAELRNGISIETTLRSSEIVNCSDAILSLSNEFNDVKPVLNTLSDGANKQSDYTGLKTKSFPGLIRPKHSKRNKAKARRNKTYMCHFCNGKWYHTLIDLRLHEKTQHSGDKPYQCRRCDLFFATSDESKKHRKEEHYRRNMFYQCDICNEEFQTIRACKRHQSQHNEDCHNGQSLILSEDGSSIEKKVASSSVDTGVSPGVTCKVCFRRFRNEENLKIHMQMQHVKSDHKDNKNSASGFQCQQCDVKFRRAAQLRVHEQMHAGVEVFNCDSCELSFLDPKKLESHNKLKHNKTFKCPECNKGYDNPNARNDHMASHINDRFKCQYCVRRFSTEALRASHELWHSEADEMFECTYCQSFYATAEQCSIHKETHSRPKGMRCRLCDAVFGTKHAARKHKCRKRHFRQKQSKEYLQTKLVRGRVGEVIYPCSVCSMRFDLKSQLTRHYYEKHADRYRKHCRFCFVRIETPSELLEHEQAVHSGDKPYMCRPCKMHFPTQDELTKHRKDTHVKKGVFYRCDVCGEEFQSVRELELHETKHDDEEENTECRLNKDIEVLSEDNKRDLFSCLYCDSRRFETLQELQNHLVNIHSNDRQPTEEESMETDESIVINESLENKQSGCELVTPKIEPPENGT